MFTKRSNLSLILSFIFFFVFGSIGISHAILSMDEVRFLFQKELGKPWGEGTAEERKAFIDNVRGREEFQDGKFKDLLQEREDEAQEGERTNIFDGREKVTSFEVRTSFETETGIAWEDATEEEQRDYQKQYKIKQVGNKEI